MYDNDNLKIHIAVNDIDLLFIQNISQILIIWLKAHALFTITSY